MKRVTSTLLSTVQVIPSQLHRAFAATASRAHENITLSEIKNVSLGKECREKLFYLKPGWAFLNHGSYGAVPKYVMAKQCEHLRRVEVHPDWAYRITSYANFAEGQRRLAEYMDCDTEDMMLVVNATTGLNAAFRSLVDGQVLKPGDSILCLSFGYPAILNTVVDTCERNQLKAHQLCIPFPILNDESFLAPVRKALAENPRIKVALFDHYTSSTALTLPIHKLTQMCKEKGIVTVIDGAHGIGQGERVSLRKLDADFYCTNVHKWMHGAKGTAFLYAARKHHPYLSPTVTSHEWHNKSAHIRFWMQGTRDESAFATLGDSLDFYEALGPKRCTDYCQNLMKKVMDMCKQRWMKYFPGKDEQYIFACAPERIFQSKQNMIFVRLPIPETDAEKMKVAQQLKNGEPLLPPHTTPRSKWLLETLLLKYNIMSLINSYEGSIWSRLSVQVYNTEEEFRTFMDRLDEMIRTQEWLQYPEANEAGNLGALKIMIDVPKDRSPDP